MSNNFNLLEGLVRRSYVGVVWSHKIQEKQGDIYLFRLRLLRSLGIFASAFTSCGITKIALSGSGQVIFPVIVAIVSFVSLAVEACIKLFNYDTLSSTHKKTANELLVIRDKYLVLMTEIKLQSDSFDSLFVKYQSLLNDLHSIYCDAPTTTPRAVRKADQALNVNLDNTFSDIEIDKFLPLELRKING